MIDDKYIIKFTFLNIANFIFLIIAFLSLVLIIGISSDYDFKNFNQKNLGSLYIFIPIFGIITYSIYFQQTGSWKQDLQKISKKTWVFGIINSIIWIILIILFIFKVFKEVDLKSKNADSGIFFLFFLFLFLVLIGFLFYANISFFNISKTKKSI